ncbi:LysM peptidoglycan-binding domain-containing protein [Ruoffia tabacinasalis]|uniref:LysM peptidoglycan-binding domain-containing protein n=1 Tax=Ruoffia tabacinasalis TaxID=87458 RepID=A0ABS0LLE7_9LACT|nr:LysM peptidoglycan-binding domain-containing protein [Ruoffia tabacinasalis]MBG9979067.1 LysM peptidoglycan-binding domain-containing protein [Ruoffia tabacinasalis]
MIRRNSRNLKLTATLLASLMALGFGQVQTNAQDFVRLEPGDEAYLPNYSLVEQYFPSVDAAVEYANANFNIDIHADFYVTMDENGAYVYYELLEDGEDPEEPEPDPEEPEDNIYVVQSGDYLYGIANQFGISVQDIIDWNDLESDLLQVGQELIVVDPSNGEEPEEPDPDPEEPEDNIYIVQSGDYLYRIANDFGITVDNLIDWNNLESNSLFVGQELIVVDPDDGSEEPDQADPEDIIYVVEAGDYLYRIAAEFGVTVQDIIDWNNLESNALQVGDELIIRQ